MGDKNILNSLSPNTERPYDYIFIGFVPVILLFLSLLLQTPNYIVEVLSRIIYITTLPVTFIRWIFIGQSSGGSSSNLLFFGPILVLFLYTFYFIFITLIIGGFIENELRKRNTLYAHGKALLIYIFSMSFIVCCLSFFIPQGF
jgi:hypothetical protein